jgi:hypothetical protein
VYLLKLQNGLYKNYCIFFSFVVRLRNPAGFLLGILEKNWYLAKKKNLKKLKVISSPLTLMTSFVVTLM